MTEKSAIILGASGAVVHAFVRRPFKKESSHQHETKLIEHVVDFDKLLKDDEKEIQEFKSIGAEAVFITLGTTRANAGSAAKFVTIDREYVLASAKAALKEEGRGERVVDGEESNQRVIYCSASMANSKSNLLYPQSKGLTEEGLAALGYSDCILFRPAFLTAAKRDKKRLAEDIFGYLMSNVAAKFTDSVDIKVDDLAKAMALAGIKGSAGITSLGAGSPPNDAFKRSKDGKVTVISNAESKRLAKKTT